MSSSNDKLVSIAASSLAPVAAFHKSMKLRRELEQRDGVVRRYR